MHGNSGYEMDWVLIQQLERDICYLYHQLSEYSDVMGDLYYGDVYALPYWDYLETQLPREARRRFIRDGCLVMIFAMCWEEIYGAGGYIGPHVDTCLQALQRVEPEDERTIRLVTAVKMALEMVQNGLSETDEFEEASLWIHQAYVRAYFRDVAEEFARNPCYQERSDPKTNDRRLTVRLRSLFGIGNRKS